MVKTSRWLAFIAVICIFFISWGSVQAQTPDSEYFAQTGHSVNGIFLRYYQSVPNPTLVFGYPLTEQFTSKDGKTVQYFQRARFEQSSSAITLTPLGRETYTPGKQLVLNNSLACQTFSMTGYSVCFAFLDFFKENGGVNRFGHPISPFEFYNDMIIQYFENARFEWRPGNPEGQRVVLTDLGRIYFDQLGEDAGFLRPAEISQDAPTNKVLRLQVRAFPAKAVTTTNDQQTIYVIVQDQNLKPVGRAKGTATIRLPSGETMQKEFDINDNGVGIFNFGYRDQPNGKLVNVEISVMYSNLKRKTTTSFRIWY